MYALKISCNYNLIVYYCIQWYNNGLYNVLLFMVWFQPLGHHLFWCSIFNCSTFRIIKLTSVWIIFNFASKLTLWLIIKAMDRYFSNEQGKSLLTLKNCSVIILDNWQWEEVSVMNGSCIYLGCVSPPPHHFFFISIVSTKISSMHFNSLVKILTNMDNYSSCLLLNT